MNKPFFSIIMATYNRAYCIEKAINSVINQTFDKWELIIVDDGSTDNTKEVVQKYINQKIKYIKLDKNRGVNVARNRAIKEVKGEYIVILDTDNMFKNDFLEKAYNIIQKEKFPYMKFLCKNQNNKNISDVFNGYLNYEDFLVEKVKGEFHSVTKSELLKNTLFFEDINGGEGITWKLIAKQTKKVLFVDKISLIYDDSGDDRLSIKNYERLYKIFKKDLEVLGSEYWRVSKKYYFLVLLKKLYYKLKK